MVLGSQTCSATRMLAVVCLSVLVGGSSAANFADAQQLIGYVATKDADVSGTPDVMDGHAVLAGSVAVTAKDHTAPITLGRGGTLRVCQTSVLHLTQSRATPSAAQLASPLLLSLDRGAIEVRMQATPTDALMTPDLRFTIRAAGPLDLRLRVARNGDTCVENRGPGAPTLAVSDPFGGSSYQVNSGQHVLFEHGSLREVVDQEATACGCPEPGISLADALVASGSGGKSSTPAAKASAQHPFPAAVSEGLAPTPEVPQAPPGEVHTQVSETMTYNATQPAAPTPPPVVASPGVAGEVSPPQRRGVRHAIGHFFKRIFGRE